MAVNDYIYTDGDRAIVRRMVGFSSTQRDNFSYGGATAVTWYNGDLYWGNSSNGVLNRANGFSSTIQETITIGSGQNDISFTNSGDMIRTDRASASSVDMYNGFSTQRVSGYAFTNVNGIGWQHTEKDQNVISSDNTNGDADRHVGFSATSSLSIDPALTFPRGAAWRDDGNAALVDANSNPNLHKLLLGWSNTILSTWSGIGGTDTGMNCNCFEIADSPKLKQVMSY